MIDTKKKKLIIGALHHNSVINVDSFYPPYVKHVKDLVEAIKPFRAFFRHAHKGLGRECDGCIRSKKKTKKTLFTVRVYVFYRRRLHYLLF